MTLGELFWEGEGGAGEASDLPWGQNLSFEFVVQGVPGPISVDGALRSGQHFRIVLAERVWV